MSEPLQFPRPLTERPTKHERFDNPRRALAYAPITIERVMAGGKHSRPVNIGLRVDENEHRIISAIKERYQDRCGEPVSDQDVIRGFIREVGRNLVDSGELDEAFNVGLLRELAELWRIKAQAIELRRQQDAELSTIEVVTHDVRDFVAEKRFSRAHEAVKDFLDLVARKVSQDPESANWMLVKILAQDGFVDAVEKLQAQGYDISLPVVE